MNNNYSKSNQLKKLQSEKALLVNKQKSLQEDITLVKNRITNIDREISEMRQLKTGIIISEHAILRLLERRFGQKEMIESVVNQIKNEIESRLIIGVKNYKINLNDNLEAVIKNNVLATVN